MHRYVGQNVQLTEVPSSFKKGLNFPGAKTNCLKVIILKQKTQDGINVDGRVDKMFPFHDKPFSWLQSFVLKAKMSGSDSLHKFSW